MDPKPWYFSKTMWVNIVSFAAAILVMAQAQPWIVANPSAAAGVASALALVNIALRLISGAPIEGSPADPTVMRWRDGPPRV